MFRLLQILFGKTKFLTISYKKFTERVGFEPTNSCLLNDFESFAFDHSATPPTLLIIYKFTKKSYSIYLS